MTARTGKIPLRTQTMEARRAIILNRLSTGPANMRELSGILDYPPSSLVNFLCRMIDDELIRFTTELAVYPSGKRYRRRVFHAGPGTETHKRRRFVKYIDAERTIVRPPKWPAVLHGDPLALPPKFFQPAVGELAACPARAPRPPAPTGFAALNVHFELECA